MGSIVSITVSVFIDWLAGSITAGVYEYVFSPYSSSTSKTKTIIEGITQMGVTVATAPYLMDLLTPSMFEKSTSIGLIGVLFFAFMYSNNMMAKLRTAHNNLVSVSQLYAGSLEKSMA